MLGEHKKFVVVTPLQLHISWPITNQERALGTRGSSSCFVIHGNKLESKVSELMAAGQEEISLTDRYVILSFWKKI